MRAGAAPRAMEGGTALERVPVSRAGAVTRTDRIALGRIRDGVRWSGTGDCGNACWSGRTLCAGGLGLDGTRAIAQC